MQQAWLGSQSHLLTWYCGKVEWLENTGGGGQFRLSQRGWFRVVEVKAVVKRGAKTFPAYLILFLSGINAGGLTASHSGTGERGRETAQCLQQGEARCLCMHPGDAYSQGSCPLSASRVLPSPGAF